MKKVLIGSLILLIIINLGFLGNYFLTEKEKVSKQENQSVKPTISRNVEIILNELNTTIEESISDSPDMSLDDYKNYLDSLDKTDVNSIQKGLKVFIKNHNSFSQEEKDKAFVKYNDFFYSIVNKYGETILNNQDLMNQIYNEAEDNNVVDLNALLDLLNNPNLAKKDPQVQIVTDQVYFNGLKFEMSEGNVYINAQPSFLYNNFKSYLSKAFQEYLAISTKDDAEICVDDACILISFDDLGNRIITWEEFIEVYPNFIYIDDIKKLHDWYLKLFLHGLNNSPLFSYPDYILNPSLKEAYENFILNP